MVEHSQTDKCSKGQGSCPFCGKDHAATHNREFYACADCGKTWRDLVYEPIEDELKWWDFLRAEYAAGRLTED